MLIKNMTAKECSDFLARIHFGRLGCTLDNEPYVVPIYFAYHADLLYAFSTVGRKIEWMRVNPKVCVEADELTDHFHWTSVIVSGHYRELPDTPEFSSERRTAQLELERHMLWWQTAYAAEQLRAPSEPFAPLFYSIRIASMTGRRAIPDAVDSTFLKIAAP
jgi:uncharacterized protein